MKVLVTGCKGQLGYDCVQELTLRGIAEIQGIDIDDLDITNEQAVNFFINKYRPDVVINCAAWTAVDKAEEHKDLVYNINALGPKYLAEATNKIGGKIVQISTDYVFDGKGEKPFEIYSSKNGLSTYGITKSQGEDFVLSATKNYFIVRTTGIFGFNGNNFVKTMIKIADSGRREINVVNDQIVSVTYSKDLAKLIVDMILTEKYGIYHAANLGYLSWCDFARLIFSEIGKDVVVHGVSSEEYRRLVPGQTIRPKNSRLSMKSLDDAGFIRLPDYQNALRRFLEEFNKCKNQ